MRLLRRAAAHELAATSALFIVALSRCSSHAARVVLHQNKAPELPSDGVLADSSGGQQ